MITDPPYGVEYDPQWRTRINSDGCVRHGEYLKNDHIADWSTAYESFAGNVAYIWHGDLHSKEVLEGISRLDFQVRAQIIWVKNVAAMSRGHYSWQHEPCWYAVRSSKNANWKGDAYESNVWQINMISNKGDAIDPTRTDHAAQKPVECMRRPIDNHTSSDQAVYDPFMGSGTTIIAAETTARVCYGCEINPLYVDMTIRRWQTFTGKEAARASDSKTFAELEKLAQ